MRLPVLLLAAVIAVACGSCVVKGVQAVRAAPDLFPPDTSASEFDPPRTDPPVCVPPDPAFVAEFSVDPLITAVPPGAMLRSPGTEQNCGSDGGAVYSRSEGARPGSRAAVTEHYRALAVAGGWTVSNPPTEGALLSATRPWRDRPVYFTLWGVENEFHAKITPLPT
jgi:hypothetical protein